MKQVTVYSTGMCGYCNSAKQLLNRLGVPFTEKRIDLDRAHAEEMKTRAPAARTVPQIFIGERHIGGFSELEKLHGEGRLLPMVGH